MKPKDNIIIGVYNGTDSEGILEWVAPHGLVMTAQGQFKMDFLSDGRAFYAHEVYDENDNFLYEVIGIK